MIKYEKLSILVEKSNVDPKDNHVEKKTLYLIYIYIMYIHTCTISATVYSDQQFKVEFVHIQYTCMSSTALVNTRCSFAKCNCCFSKY